jgi:MFS transporter, MHS family, shikimate and dehydroshikimate transport protein
MHFSRQIILRYVLTHAAHDGRRVTIPRRGRDMSVHLAIRDATTERKGGMATVVFAGSVGTIIEWYDFLIYGTAAALVFNTLFFPNIDPLAGTLASLATYSVGFVARPIGGAIFGHFGDRIGRKIMLMITMVIMALGTFAVGCLPTYQQIGVWAPILLVILRLVWCAPTRARLRLVLRCWVLAAWH